VTSKTSASGISRASWAALVILVFAAAATWFFASQATALPRSHALNAAALLVGLLLPALTLAIVGVVRAKSKNGRVIGCVTMLLVALPLLLGLLGVAAMILFAIIMISGG
jgi:uncharacterized membrane protein